MGRPAKTKDTIKKNTIADMKSLGIYKTEYDPLINVYCDLMSQYIRATEEFEVNINDKSM